MRARLSLTFFALSMLSACAHWHFFGGSSGTGTPDNEPTIKSLAGRTVDIEQDQSLKTSEQQAIDAYKRFLASAPKSPKASDATFRAEAMRRIGDLEMELRRREIEAYADLVIPVSIRRYEFESILDQGHQQEGGHTKMAHCGRRLKVDA